MTTSCASEASDFARAIERALLHTSEYIEMHRNFLEVLLEHLRAEREAGLQATRLLRELDEYLSSNLQNSVWSGSKLHREVKRLLHEAPASAHSAAEGAAP